MKNEHFKTLIDNTIFKNSSLLEVVGIRSFEQAAPNIINSISKFVEAGYAIKESEADYKKTLADALTEMANRMYQAAHDQFQAEGQQLDAIKQFIEQFVAAT